MNNDAEIRALDELLTVIKRLRNPGGCPWDIEQSPMTLRTTLLEEVYETIEAIEEQAEHADNNTHVKEELGDVLLNALMISYMYEQSGDFSIAAVCDTLREKLVRRHPHVFGQTQGFAGPDSSEKTVTAETVLDQWETIKQTVEHKDRTSVLDDIPKTFPALLRSRKLQKRAAKIGFDWRDIRGVDAKLTEEITELREAMQEKDNAQIEDELGDVLFVLVNIARFSDVDPEASLTHANKKFETRVRIVEKKMRDANVKSLADVSDEQALQWWIDAKKETGRP